jgi:hypothetical protein
MEIDLSLSLKTVGNPNNPLPNILLLILLVLQKGFNSSGKDGGKDLWGIKPFLMEEDRLSCYCYNPRQRWYNNLLFPDITPLEQWWSPDHLRSDLVKHETSNVKTNGDFS